MKLFIISFLMGLAVTLHAAKPTDEGVKFLDNIPMEKVFLQARQEGKWVLADCYTSWCGPCKQMAREVFPLPEVGTYVNSHFVCVKIDMEKGEGPAIGKKYAVVGYPTFLFFSPDGQLRHQSLGSCRAEDFILLCERALKGGNFDAMRQQYEAGQRDETFLLSYLYQLYDHNQRDESLAIALQLLDGKEESLLTDNQLYRLFLRFDNDFYSPRLAFVMNHRKDFENRYDSLELANKVDMLVNMAPSQCFHFDKQRSVYDVDESGLDHFVQTMREYGITDWHQREMNPRLLAAEYQQQWNKYVDICDLYIREGYSDDAIITMWIRRTYQLTDIRSHGMMKKWIRKRCKALRDQENDKWLNTYNELWNQYFTAKKEK